MPRDRVKTTIEFGDKTLTFEGPSDFVDQQVAKYTGLHINPAEQAQATSTKPTIPKPVSERELIRDKRPSNHAETVTVLAFCLAQAGQAEFDEEDMKRAYLRADVRPPKVLSQAIRDAKNKFDFVQDGKISGKYRLSPHGDRTVRFDLPTPSKGHP